MIAACPGCNARYRIESGRLRAEGVRLRCSRCESVFRVRPPAVEAKGSSELADSVPAPAPTPSPPAPEVPARAPSPPAAEVPAQAPSPPAPEVPAPTPSPPALETPVPTLSPPAPSEGPVGDPPRGDSPSVDGSRLVLVADPEVEQGKATASSLAEWGLQAVLVHDGVEAMLTIQRLLPRTIVIDAALPKMFGFQICEVVKRNESLRGTHVILVGAIHNQNRYRRPPGDLYGADSYIERHQLPGALRTILEESGMLASSAAPSTADSGALSAPPPVVKEVAPPTFTPAPEPAVTPAPISISPPEAEAVQPSERVASPPARAPEPQPVVGEQDEMVAKAERLARIVVSDIVLYNQEKFESALRAGNVLEAMEVELAEGRSLFNQRVDAPIRGQRDFLAEELLRVAKGRGGI